MRSYIDYDLGNTINLYLLNNSNPIPVNQLENYNFLHENCRKMNLLDIKYIKRFSVEKVRFKDLFLATYEILDSNNQFRPYVLLFTKEDNSDFFEIRLWL